MGGRFVTVFAKREVIILSSKKDNRKMVDMLERMGMIKKTEGDASPAEQQDVSRQEVPAPAPPPGNVFFSPLQPAAERFPSVPAPASAASIFPEHISPPPQETAPTPVAKAVSPKNIVVPSQTAPANASQKGPLPSADDRPTAVPEVLSADVSEPPEPIVVEPPAHAPAYISPETGKSVYSNLSVSSSFIFDNKSESSSGSLIESFWADTPAVDSTVDRYLDIEELYHNFRMKVNGIDTIYLIEDYIKTLPDSLPAELRRSIIMRIVASSGFDFEKLLNDGIDRVNKLNEYAAQFASRTDEVVTRQNTTIQELEHQIEQVQATINERKNLHKRQFLTIEDEAQRLKEILDFITK